MVMRLLPLVVVVLGAVPAFAQSGPPPKPGVPSTQSDHMQSGVRHFERAFFELTPQKREAEARVEFDHAIAAFERELAATPASADAHRYLAKIHAVRKEFGKAGAHFDKVAELEPFNVDACVLAALAYLDADDAPGARLRLVGAKDRTLDPVVLARLDGYIAKVDALKR